VAPGGEGIERDLQVLEDATVSLITERRVSQPWGLAGGEPGSAGENWLLPQGDEVRAERLPDKCTIQLKAGDVLRMLTPGGGGWGDPAWSNAGTEAGQTGISRRADNPALLAGLPDLGVDVDVVVADVEAGRASR
jgi:N-methylhydantoinase B/oxoprolinase/acetone carboxylase alpha subunit